MLNGVEVIDQHVHRDERGTLIKILTVSQLGKSIFGEIYYIDAMPGSVRGNHYHKDTTEWFCVLDGSATLKLRDERTKDEDFLKLDGKNNIIIKIPPYISHAFIVDQPTRILAFSDREYTAQDNDTFPVELG